MQDSTGDNGPATAATLADPTGIAVDALTGNLYIVGYLSSRIRMVTKSTGIITTVAGSGLDGYSGDGGPAKSAQLSAPTGVGVDSTRRLIYIADNANNVIRMINMTTGNIFTVAGGKGSGDIPAYVEGNYGNYGYSGTPGGDGDGGLATSATLSNPTRNVVELSSGNIYIADSGNNRIRLVTRSTGIISAVAGTGAIGYTGDGGLAIQATLMFPTGIALDPSSSDLYIADSGNNCIRVVKRNNNIISTVAGTGRFGNSGDDGVATAAELNDPRGVSVSASSRYLYIADSGNNCIRMVTLSTGIITTVAGTGTSGYSGDGREAIYALLYSPFSVATDPSSEVIYIADSFNYVVRSVNGTTAGSPRPSVAPTYSALPMTASPSVLAPSVNPMQLGEDAPLYFSMTVAVGASSSHSANLIYILTKGDGAKSHTLPALPPAGTACQIWREGSHRLAANAFTI
jgi:trimeric autotransporter adhesin